MKIRSIICLSISIASSSFSMKKRIKKYDIKPVSTLQYYQEMMCQKGKTLNIYSDKGFPETKIKAKLSSFLSKTRNTSERPIYCAIYPKKFNEPFLKIFTVGLCGIGALTNHLPEASLLALGVHILHEYLEAPAYFKIMIKKNYSKTSIPLV